MASVFTHPALPLAFWMLAQKKIHKRLLLFGIIFSVLPDIDVIAFHYEIPYGHMFGHRGFSHSILLAGALSGAILLFKSFLKTDPKTIFWFLTASMISHGLLDAMTSGGLGIGFFIPFDNSRYFLPWRPIAVSPIGAGSFFSERGMHVIESEIQYIWIPVVSFAAVYLIFSKIIQRVRTPVKEK